MTIRIASYNLWNGAKQTYSRLADFAKEQQFDVLCLQEVNGWQDNDFARLKDFADRAEYTDYEFGNSISEYKLVSFSMLPITFRTVHLEGFWHCAIEIHIEVDGREVVIVNLHLDPWKEDPRLREIERLFELIDATKPTAIIGDFNSLARSDKYPPEFLVELQRRKIAKYGQDALDYRVTDFLTAAGFVDAAEQVGRKDMTVPTAYNTDEVHEIPSRIDYAFVNQALLPLVRDYSIIKNTATDKISDHYPIVLTLSTDSPTQPVADDVGKEKVKPAKPAPPPKPAKPAPSPKPPEHPKETVIQEDGEVEIKLH